MEEIYFRAAQLKRLAVRWIINISGALGVVVLRHLFTMS